MHRINGLDVAQKTELIVGDGPYTYSDMLGMALRTITHRAEGFSNWRVIDGVRFNTATFRTGPNQYLASIDPLVVHRIEVLRGPSSVLFGSGAMGGGLHVVTKNPDVRRRTSGSAGGRLTSADLGRTGWLQLRQRHGVLGFVAGGSAAGFSTLRSGGGRRWPLSGYQRGAWHAKAVLGKPHAPGRLTAAYFGSMLRNVGRTDQLGRGDVRTYDNDDHLGYMALRFRGNGVLRQVDTNVSFHRLVEVVERSTCGTGAGVVIDLRACARLSSSAVQQRRRNYDAVNALGFESSAQLAFLDDLLRVGIGGEAYRDSVTSRASQAEATSPWEPRSRGQFSDGSTYRTLGLFVHANGQLLDFKNFGKLRVSAGGRLSN
ncbi:MAG: TonB-dependent receptor plug domain-containing protein, partial [Myxococcota bacterium]